MHDEHLSVPNSSSFSGATATGRPRSASNRSTGSRDSDIQHTPAVPQHDHVGRQDYFYQPSIRIRRLPSLQSVTEANTQANTGNNPPSYGQDWAEPQGHGSVGRNRSISAPQRLHVETGNNGQDHLTGVTEETISPTTGRATENQSIPATISNNPQGEPRPNPPASRVSRRLRTVQSSINPRENDYEDGLVDYLDVVDPEVSMLSTLTNVQNSLFVPDLGKYVNRRPTYNLTRRPTVKEEVPEPGSLEEEIKRRPVRPELGERTHTGATINTISSNINDRYYAVLPHGVRLSGWSEEDKLELNDHVRHMLHSRRSKFRRGLKGFGQYVRRPLGFFITLYATLITLFGLAWVLFLIGWVNVGGRQSYLINVIDNVLVALFAVMGDGLAPFRVVDTYHMCFIAHYHHLTWRLRREKALPKLEDHNDLPAIQPQEIEENQEMEKEPEFSVLSPEQQRKLVHHQKKFAKSHSFYKPHETMTHHAFPLRLLVAIVVLLDCHSLLQIALGTCTWAISYHVRPFALTTVILCCSITVNITAGILISVGDKRTRKKDVLEKMDRQQLTEEAMKKVEKARLKEDSRHNSSGGILEPGMAEDITVGRDLGHADSNNVARRDMA